MQATTHGFAAFAREAERQNLCFERALAALEALDPLLEFFIAHRSLEELESACAFRTSAPAAAAALRV